jgi:glutathione S-transferase
LVLKHYGWEVSPYSAKTRFYLRYKAMEHEDIHPSFWMMKRVIEKRVGFIVMPIVVQSDGATLQDSSEIIDTLEAGQPEPSITPPGPAQKLVSLLVELCADEWLPIISMHTRWNIAESRACVLREFGKNAFPFLPTWLGSKLAAPFATKMQSYLPVLGISEATIPEIEAWMQELFDALEQHFSEFDYLLGGRPCLGDFSLAGPLYAHVGRDAGSRHFIAERAHLAGWLERMQTKQSGYGPFLPDDQVPETLDPLLRRILTEQLPVLRETSKRIGAWAEANPENRKVPRGLGELEFSLGDARGTRKALTIGQWMLQRPLDLYGGLSVEERVSTDALLTRLGSPDAMAIEVRRRLTRRNFRIVLE